MNILKNALVIGSALVAVSANAQFGAASNADFSGGQGSYGYFSPFTRASGGGTATGFLIGFEKVISTDAQGALRLGGFYSDLDSATFYQIHARKALSADLDIQLGFLGGDITGNNTDFSLLAFKGLATASATNSITAEVFAGLYYQGVDSDLNLQAGIKASYPLQNKFSIDGSFWFVSGSPNITFLSLGIGYKF